MSFEKVRARSCRLGVWLWMAALGACAACTSSVRDVPSLRTRTTRIEARAAVIRNDTPEHRDGAIASALRRRLAEQGHLDSVNVHVHHGAVVLDGTLSHLLAKRAVEESAAQRGGVTRIENRIEVRPDPRPDSSIESDVRRAISIHPALVSVAVDTRVDDGHVRLAGTVASHDQRAFLEEIAAGIRGVKSVTTGVEIIPARARDDHRLHRVVRNRLEHDARLDARNIRVRVRRGRVVLTGTVPSESQRQLAERISGIDGVREVNASALHVRESLRYEPPRAGRPERDAIARALTDALRCHAWLHIENMSLRIGSDGVVTMSGEVRSLPARRAILELASATTGVTRLIDRLSVLPHPLVDDEVLEERASDLLGMNPYLAHERIVLRVQHGVVVLVGEVRTEVARTQADRWVAQIAGVRRIDNRLELARNDPR